MREKNSFITLIQQEIERLQRGILVSIKLLNEDELSILLDNTQPVLSEFYQIVEKICNQESITNLIINKSAAKIYLVMPDNKEALEKIAFQIHAQTQSYVNEKFPEVYFKSSVGSIRYDYATSGGASKLLSMMRYNLLHSRENGGYYNYDTESVDIELLRKRNKNMNMLRKCILANKIQFVYQPIVERESGKISYYECLLRALDENNKLISVGPMMEDAENKGLINLIDSAVLQMAVSELTKDPSLSLSVNISNIGMLNENLHKKAVELFTANDIAGRLIIEITETSLNQDFTKTKNFIELLHKLGCRFALDDFGAGFTSFKQLLHLPIDIIKIDGEYIRDILENKRSRFFVESLIKLAENLGIKTVAEFVENSDIAKYLIELKIGAMQGDFFLPASPTRHNLE